MEGACSDVRQPVPKTSVKVTLKTSPAMWNTQQSTPAPSASHKLQSRVSPAAAPPLLQAVPCTSCTLHILPPSPRTTHPCPLPSHPFSTGEPPAGPTLGWVFQEKRESLYWNPGSTHSGSNTAFGLNFTSAPWPGLMRLN